MHVIYSIVSYLSVPFIIFYLFKRSIKNKKYLKNFKERFALNFPQKSNIPIIWIHAVSVGETRAIRMLAYLINKHYPNYQLLITQMTPTGKDTAKELFPNAICCYLPYDIPYAIKKFYKYYKPKVALIMETEIWPNVIYYAKKNHIPIFLINARLSAKSLKSYKLIRFFILPLINKLTMIISQDEITLNNFKTLGYKGALSNTGSTKFDIIINQEQIKLAETFTSNLKNKKIIVFFSTKDGEELLLLTNIKKLKSFLIIIVPRHPERFKEVEQLLIENKIIYQKRTEINQIEEKTQILLGDTIGEAFLYYRMSQIAIIGGSFNDKGGQNLIEPIYLKIPVIFGPSMYNFAKIARDAINMHCAIQVDNIHEALMQAKDLLKNKELYNLMSNNCIHFIKKYQGASQKILNIIKKYL